jgi:pimeloyl-ACP methyl ester carboxylesterase
MGTAAVNGITIGYDDEGHGPPLVLVHGHPFDRSMWAPQVAEFARSGWRVIAPDLRGYGHSTVVAGTTPLETFARDLAALLDHLEVDDIVLGGLSMGGQIVMECYRQFAHRIRGLLLADTSGQADTDEGRMLRYRTADRLLAEGMAGYADETLATMIAPYNVAALPAVAAHVHAMMAAAPPAGAAAALRGRAARRDYCRLLTGVSVPTLVVVGRDDEFTPVGDAEFMHRRIPDATLAVIDGAGHLPNLEQPAAFNNVLRAFLSAQVVTASG